MKSNLKERRNAAIVKRVQELLGSKRPIMDVYSQVGEEFWLEETTIRLIYNKNSHYSKQVLPRNNDLPK